MLELEYQTSFSLTDPCFSILLALIFQGTMMDSAISAAATICNTATSEMPPEIALCLFENGAFLVKFLLENR